MADAQKLANDLPSSSFDLIAFTNGIVPGNTRVATKEGVEMDMAASALSRYVMLQVMEDKLKPTCRIFNWGKWMNEHNNNPWFFIILNLFHSLLSFFQVSLVLLEPW